MKIVFMGTPALAATVLEELASRHDVVCAYTRPDAVRSRGKALEASPVKKMAEQLGVPVRTPSTFKSEEELAYLRGLQADVICVAAYGMLLPKAVLESAKFGCLNVHASLLPRWRGAAPVERAILAGDEEVGVCIMRMEEGLDTGAYCISRSIPVADRTADFLTDELANLGAQALMTALAHVEAGCAAWIEQDESRVEYASKIQKGELDIAPEDGVVQAFAKVRASSAAHPCKVNLGGKGATVLAAKPCAEDDAAVQAAQQAAGPFEPGSLRFAQKRLLLGCADGVLEIVEVKPDGKKAMGAAAFAAGLQGVKKGTLSWGKLNG